ncbi:MAG: hypothetical protein M3Z92_05975, partial [Bacteroidota bacterium]|nr:hypothetical protein [Bacteroidota bacterium]
KRGRRKNDVRVLKNTTLALMPEHLDIFIQASCSLARAMVCVSGFYFFALGAFSLATFPGFSTFSLSTFSPAAFVFLAFEDSVPPAFIFVSAFLVVADSALAPAIAFLPFLTGMLAFDDSTIPFSLASDAGTVITQLSTCNPGMAT